MQIFEDASLHPVRLDHIGDKKPRQAHRVIVQQGSVDVFWTIVVSDKKGIPMVFACLKIRLDSGFCTLGEIHDAQLASLSSYGKLERVKVDILTVESGELRYAQARRVDALGDSVVALSDDRLSWYSFKKPNNLFMCQKRHLTVGRLHEIECGRIEAGDLLLFEIFEP